METVIDETEALQRFFEGKTVHRSPVDVTVQKQFVGFFPNNVTVTYQTAEPRYSFYIQVFR